MINTLPYWVISSLELSWTKKNGIKKKILSLVTFIIIMTVCASLLAEGSPCCPLHMYCTHSHFNCLIGLSLNPITNVFLEIVSEWSLHLGFGWFPEVASEQALSPTIDDLWGFFLLLTSSFVLSLLAHQRLHSETAERKPEPTSLFD